MTRRQLAWVLVLIVEVGYVAWGGAAAAAPDRLLGPGGRAILPAGYEGYTGASWPELVAADPGAAGFMTVLYRMYGIYNVLCGVVCGAIAVTAFRRGDGWAWWTLLVGNTVALVAAMTYDKTVHAIGPFELSEYLGLGMIWAALAITAPFASVQRRAQPV